MSVLIIIIKSQLKIFISVSPVNKVYRGNAAKFFVGRELSLIFRELWPIFKKGAIAKIEWGKSSEI